MEVAGHFISMLCQAKRLEKLARTKFTTATIDGEWIKIKCIITSLSHFSIAIRLNLQDLANPHMHGYICSEVLTHAPGDEDLKFGLLDQFCVEG
ncbi:hypothetical protein SCA6_016143 [Theobroma cacao]